MSTSLIPFLFEEDYLLRSATLNGAPWFIVMDVCRVLEIGNTGDALARLDDDEKGFIDISDGTPGTPRRAIINESGLYTLILRSHGAITPGTVAHRFRKWVTSEVLPAIRRTGAYQPQRPPLDLEGRREATRLARELVKETTPAVRRMLYAMLTDTTTRIGIPTPALECLGRDGPQPSDLSTRFFSAIAAAGSLKINHARDPRLLAVNLNELNQHASTGSFAVLVDGNMRRALKADPCYRGVRTIRSAIDPRRTLKCWVFASEGGRE